MEKDYRITQLQGVTDLTVLARIKEGAVPGAFNVMPYVERLRRVLRTLNTVRQASRESSLVANLFPDAVARFRTVHFFRFGVLPPGTADQRQQLFLNVTVDSGWEPYMRFIWKPVGSMLDIIFCHCEDYPLARLSSFQDYIAWVRDHEVNGRFFFTDSPATASDGHYQRRLEDLVVRSGDSASFDRDATRLALPSQTTPTPRDVTAAFTALRALRAVASLRDLFPPRPDSNGTQTFEQAPVLWRFASDLFDELKTWVSAPLELERDPRWQTLCKAFAPELAWLCTQADAPPTAERRALAHDFYAGVQSGIARAYAADVAHGALLLLRVTDAERARRWLAKQRFSSANGEPDEHGVYMTVALTYPGLQHLGAPSAWLRGLPHEFSDGMAARAGLLGDLHVNHPDHWQLPPRNWPEALAKHGLPPVEPSTVDILIQLRAALTEAEITQAGWMLAERFKPLIAHLHDAAGKGVEVMSVQAMRHHPRRQSDDASRDHFGYVDGLSQPTLDGPRGGRDHVLPGELFLGYANNRGDGDSALDAVLANGSFVVVRKLRQHSDRFEKAVKDAADRYARGDEEHRAQLVETIKAKLMGREPGGRVLTAKGPKAGNDFDFKDDPHGSHCPFQSHIRRSNPRAAVPPLMAMPPRLARRGMSYGPRREDGDVASESHGLVFIAYNASIAEQFEVIQNWLAGGGSTGLSSNLHDPLLGVPEPGRARAYRFEHGDRVLRVELGDEPLVTLDWGLYAFVPAIGALHAIATQWNSPVSRAPRAAIPPPTTADADGEIAAGRFKYEDDMARAARWAAVRGAPDGVKQEGAYGLMVARPDKVLGVLKDDGRHFSVGGLGARMRRTIGEFYLGLDDAGPCPGHATLGTAVNQVVEDFFADESAAYQLAYQHATQWIAGTTQRAAALHDALGPVVDGASLDVIELVRQVVGHLCQDWFGLVDGPRLRLGMRNDDLRCLADDDELLCYPGDLLAISRYVFSPHPPADPVEARATVLGRRVLAAFETLLAEGARGTPLKPLVRRIVDAVQGMPCNPASVVAGVMLGFPAPVVGSLAGVFVNWITTRELWRLQQDLAEGGAQLDYAYANEKLRQPLLTAMATAPTPYAVWRTSTVQAPLAAASLGGCPVVLGLAAVMQDPVFAADPDSHLIMFGGTHQAGHRYYAPHACPGYALSMGAMLGCAAALLRAGDLRATTDPRMLRIARP